MFLVVVVDVYVFFEQNATRFISILYLNVVSEKVFHNVK